MWELITNAISHFFARAIALGPLLVFRVLLGMGIGYGVYSIGLPVLVSFVQSYLNSLPDWAVQLLGALKVDVVLTLTFSAYAAKLGVRAQVIKLDTTPGTP